MSLKGNTALDAARAVGTVGIGLCAGMMAGITLVTMPPHYTISTLSPRDRLHLWSKTYDYGKTFAVSTIILSSSAFALASALAQPTPAFLPSSFISRHRTAALALCSLVTLANLPYTLLAMMPGIKRMKEVEEQYIKADESEKIDTDSMILRWVKQHNVRVALSCSVFVLAVAELTLC